MRIKTIVLILIGVVFLSGCTVETPFGSYGVKADESNHIVVEMNGKEYSVQTDSAKAYVDQLLESVDLPSGSTDELKDFVYDGLETMGFDLDSVDWDSDEIKDAVDQLLQEEVSE